MFSSFDKFSGSKRDNTDTICDIKKPVKSATKAVAGRVCDKKCQGVIQNISKSDAASVFRK
jgi:hypothetical protein